MTVVDEIRRNVALGRYSYHDAVDVLCELANLPYCRAKSLLDEKPILKLIDGGSNGRS